MPIVTRLRSVTFSDGRSVPVPRNGVVVLVGPNNSGKSAALREIYRHLTGSMWQPHELGPHVVKEVEFEKKGTTEELEAWLEENTHAYTQRSSGRRHYSRPTGTLSLPQAQSEWSGSAGFGPSLAAMFAMQAHTPERLQMIQQAQHWNPFEEGPSAPLQVMFANETLERVISDISVEAGWDPLHLSRLPGGPIELYVGTPSAKPSTTSIDEAYVDELRTMPLLREQGDGMRSFVGIMLVLTAAGYPIVLIDEPEAFLHPPQARLLGRKIASESARNQVVLATHDTDLLFGLLSERADIVTVVRITRDGGVNPSSVLPPEDIARLWDDPLLASSNLLDGLFHRGVILCEGDTDASYYGAVLESERDDRAHELFLTHCGGKARLAMVVRALAALDVPVAVIADLDLLRERDRIRGVVEALGGRWSDFERDWVVLTNGVTSMGRAPAIADAREAIDLALAEAATAGSRLTPDASRTIRAATQVEDGWSLIKDAGIAAARQGDASAAADRLLAGLATLRLFLVPVGELERFHKSVPAKSSAWLAEVLTQGLHAQDGPHREFVREVAASFGT